MEAWVSAVLTLGGGAALGAVVTWFIAKRFRNMERQRQEENARRERAWLEEKFKRIEEKFKKSFLHKRHVTLQEEFLLAEMLAKRIKDKSFSPDVIFAVSPGGEMIAQWLSRRFLRKHGKPAIPVRTVLVDTEYKPGGEKREQARVTDDVEAVTAGLAPTTAVLLVNDISRAGVTLQAARNFLLKHFRSENLRTAVLLRHEDSYRPWPDFEAAPTDETVRFVWKEPLEPPGKGDVDP